MSVIPLGKDNDSDPQKGLAHQVVTTLLVGLEGKGYHVYTDNFYTSPTLYHELHTKGFEACGTVRIDRVGIPKSFQKATVARGT